LMQTKTKSGNSRK